MPRYQHQIDRVEKKNKHYVKTKKESLNGHYNNVKVQVKYPKPRYRAKLKYDFLQYTRIVFKWATENYNLRRPEIEMLLYLYPKGTFTQTEFTTFHKTIGMYQQKAFREIIAEGWILMWRPRRGHQSALYCLSDKAKRMCSRMHRICTGEEEIPTNPRANALASNNDKRINGYYLDIIKKMNKDKGD